MQNYNHISTVHTLHYYSGADNCISRKNRSNYDTSNRFGIDTLQGSPFMNKTRATQNFNMAAIFQDGRHRLSRNTIFCLKKAADGRKQLMWLRILYSKRSKCLKCCYKHYTNVQILSIWPPIPMMAAITSHIIMAHNFALKWQQTVKEINFLIRDNACTHVGGTIYHTNTVCMFR